VKRRAALRAAQFGHEGRRYSSTLRREYFSLAPVVDQSVASNIRMKNIPLDILNPIRYPGSVAMPSLDLPK